jgi:hypothetical protein
MNFCMYMYNHQKFWFQPKKLNEIILAVRVISSERGCFWTSSSCGVESVSATFLISVFACEGHSGCSLNFIALFCQINQLTRSELVLSEDSKALYLLLTVSTTLIFIKVLTTALWILQINLIMTNYLNVLDTTQRPVSMLVLCCCECLAGSSFLLCRRRARASCKKLLGRSWAQTLRSLRVPELPKPSLAVDNFKFSSSSLVSATCQAIQKNISGSILERDGGAR